MNDNIRDLFSEYISDETAHYLCNFFYELALVFEATHLGEIMRYQKSQVKLSDERSNQNHLKEKVSEEDSQDPLF